MSNTELYKILEIDQKASQEDIKKAYKKLAMKHHPDKGGDAEKFKKISEAYEVLSDENKRNMYDRGMDPNNQGMNINPDIFSQMFGGFNMFGQNVRRKDNPVYYELKITLEKLCNNHVQKLQMQRKRICSCIKPCSPCNGKGVKVTVRQFGPGMIQQFQEHCNLCNGSGSTNDKSCDKCQNGLIDETKLFEIKLSPDIPDGHKFVFTGEGNNTSPNIDIGDFIVGIKYEKHDIFIPSNKNLVMNLNIPLIAALTGYKTVVTHPTNVQVDIDTTGYIIDGKSPFIIKGRGMTPANDLHVKFNVEFPKEISSDKHEILKCILI